MYMSVFVQERQWKQMLAFTCVIHVYSVLICYVCTRLHFILNKYIYLQQTIYQISNLHRSELSHLVGGHKQYLIATTALCSCSYHCMPRLNHTLLLIHDLWLLFLTFLVLFYYINQPSPFPLLLFPSHMPTPPPPPNTSPQTESLFTQSSQRILIGFILHIRLSGQ